MREVRRPDQARQTGTTEHGGPANRRRPYARADSDTDVHGVLDEAGCDRWTFNFMMMALEQLEGRPSFPEDL